LALAGSGDVQAWSDDGETLQLGGLPYSRLISVLPDLRERERERTGIQTVSTSSESVQLSKKDKGVQRDGPLSGYVLMSPDHGLTASHSLLVLPLDSPITPESSPLFAPFIICVFVVGPGKKR
jgi:hypothetical protein